MRLASENTIEMLKTRTYFRTQSGCHVTPFPFSHFWIGWLQTAATNALLLINIYDFCRIWHKRAGCARVKMFRTFEDWFMLLREV